MSLAPFDPFEYQGATPPPGCRDVAPLSDLPDNHRASIGLAVQEPHPPPKWLHFGGNPRRPVAIMESRAWYEWHWLRGIDPDKIRSSLSQTIRRQVIERDGYVCGICGDDVEPDDVHIDHIQPWSLGGSDEPDNLQVSHSRCNLLKGNRV